MTGTRLLHGVRQAPQIVPAGRDVHRLAQRGLNPVGHLLTRPCPLVVWWGLEAEIQRCALDLVEHKRVAAATRTPVRQTLGTLGVVQRDGVSEPRWTSLHDACHVAACSGFGLAEEKQGVPAGVFVVVRCRLVPVPEFFDAQMGSDR